jgi:hypothetical protein
VPFSPPWGGVLAAYTDLFVRNVAATDLLIRAVERLVLLDAVGIAHHRGAVCPMRLSNRDLAEAVDVDSLVVLRAERGLDGCAAQLGNERQSLIRSVPGAEKAMMSKRIPPQVTGDNLVADRNAWIVLRAAAIKAFIYALSQRQIILASISFQHRQFSYHLAHRYALSVLFFTVVQSSTEPIPAVNTSSSSRRCCAAVRSFHICFIRLEL